MSLPDSNLNLNEKSPLFACSTFQFWNFVIWQKWQKCLLGGPPRGMFANLYFILYHYQYIQKWWQLVLGTLGKDGTASSRPARYLQRGHWKPLAHGPGFWTPLPDALFQLSVAKTQPTWPRPCPRLSDSRFAAALTTSKHFLSVSRGAKINTASQATRTGWGED